MLRLNRRGDNMIDRLPGLRQMSINGSNKAGTERYSDKDCGYEESHD